MVSESVLALCEHSKQELARLVLRLEAERDELRRKLDTAVGGSPWFATMRSEHRRAALLEVERWAEGFSFRSGRKTRAVDLAQLKMQLRSMAEACDD